MFNQTSGKSFIRTYAAITVALCALALYQTEAQTQALLKIRTRYKWVLLMLFFAANAAAALYATFRNESAPLSLPKIDWPRLAAPLRYAGACLLLVVPVLVFVIAREDFFGRGMEGLFRLLWLFWWLALLQAAGLRWLSGMEWPRALAAVLLGDGLLAAVYTLLLPVSAYPFSVGWSEASRFYYGSLVLSKSIYGFRAPLSFLHGSRYLLLAVPFLIKGVSIWAARLWQQSLWIGLTALTSLSLVRRLGQMRPLSAVLFGAWSFLFLLQGAVYYHLQVSVVVIFLTVSMRHPWRSLAGVVLASFWAGMSRLNWFPVPAMLAIALYLLETPVSQGRSLRQYLRIPALWAVVGLLSALAGQASYAAISGVTNLEAFGSSFTSALLWYRWFPSETNPIGIIPGTVIVSMPVWAMLAVALRGRLRSLHPLRVLGVLSMLLVLLVGGLVVSTKIGGGGDLHNMDAYLVLLELTAAYLAARRVQHEAGQPPLESPLLWPIVACALFVPVAFALMKIGSPIRYSPVRAAEDLATLQQQIPSMAGTGEVLFMYERQLLTFGMIRGVRLVPEDEVVTLMEMAISGNRAYLERYYADLQSHRFAVIVAHPQNLGVETGDFMEENDAWTEFVAKPLLCQYKPALTLPYSKVQLLVPRARPCAEFPPKLGTP